MHDYRILTSGDADKLAAAVLMWLRDGWELQGGVAATGEGRTHGDRVFAQAVYRRTPPPGPLRTLTPDGTPYPAHW